MSTSSFDKTAKIWSIDGRELLTLKGHTDGVRSVVFSPNGKQLATASNDKTVKIWSIDGRELLTLKGHTGSVNSAVFSPNGKQLATASDDKTVKIWSFNSVEEIYTLNAHTGSVNSVVFSPNGKQLATVSDDKTIKIWSVDSGEEIYTFSGGISRITSVAFSPDGKQLASTSWDGNVKIYNIDIVSLKGLACYWLQDYIATTPELQKRLSTCQDPKTLEASAPALVAEARTNGMSGKPEAALSLFQEAKKLDNSISLNPELEVAPYFITKGEKLAKEEDIKAALVAYDEAIKRNPKIKISAASWNTLCWNGSIYNSVSEVIFACNNAVNLEPDNLNIRNNRAIARSLAGDTNGAIAEIEVMLPKIYRQNLESLLLFKEKEYPSIIYSEQQSRLEDLKEGKNPSPDEKLEEWRQQAKKDRDS